MKCTGSKSTLRLTTPVAMLIGVAILAILAALPAGALVPTIDPAGLARAIAAQERHTDQLLAVTGVVGTAVGVRGDGKPVVKIFTETAVAGLPQELDGIPVQVQVTGRIFARHHRPGHGGGPGHRGDDPPLPDGNDCPDTTARADRPVCIGISTGHPAITAGTIGCRVTDGTDVYALSNNHVYANQNPASIGDAVIQPGTVDGGSSPADDIGTLDDFEPIVFGRSSNNVIDAAIALSSTDLLGKATPWDGYGTPKSTTVRARINMKVMKYGRTTGQTKGRVSAINATVNVIYGSGVARFIEQIIIEPGNFSAGGDSGSLIVSDQPGASKRKAVGLLFAGNLTFSVANPIDAVLGAFGVTVDGE